MAPKLTMLLTHLLLIIFTAIINDAAAVLLKHPDPKDFLPFKDHPAYKENEEQLLQFDTAQKCICGKEYVNEMALVYFERRNGEKEKCQKYLVSQEATKGSHAKVYHAVPLINNEELGHCIAIKISIDSSEYNAHQIRAEAFVLSTFAEEGHIVNMEEILWYKNVQSKHMEAIAMELGESDLLVYVQNSFKSEDLLDKELIPILEQVLLGLKALHDKDFIYFDLKPANMLVMRYIGMYEEHGLPRPMSQIYLKLIDLAGAKKIPKGQNFVKIPAEELVTTRDFQGPEKNNVTEEGELKVLFLHITKAFDIWSFGISILKLLFCTKSFEDQFAQYTAKGKNSRDVEFMDFTRAMSQYVIPEIEYTEKNTQFLQMIKLAKKLTGYLEGKFPNAMKLVKMCLKLKPEDRPTVDQLLEREFSKTPIHLVRHRRTRPLGVDFEVDFGSPSNYQQPKSPGYPPPSPALKSPLHELRQEKAEGDSDSSPSAATPIDDELFCDWPPLGRGGGTSSPRERAQGLGEHGRPLGQHRGKGKMPSVLKFLKGRGGNDDKK